MKPKPTLLLAALVCAAGVVVGVRAFLPEREPPKPVYTPEGLVPYGKMRFSRADDPARLADAAIDAFLLDGLSRVETDPPLDDAAIASLVQRARARLRMIVGPDGPSLEEVRAAEGVSPAGNPVEVTGARAQWADYWAGAPVNLRTSQVRVIPADGADDGAFRLGTSARSPLRGEYPSWSRDDQVLEVVFAAHPKSSDDARDRMPTYLAFAYLYDTNSGRWRFVDCVMYYSGRGAVPPAF